MKREPEKYVLVLECGHRMGSPKRSERKRCYQCQGGPMRDVKAVTASREAAVLAAARRACVDVQDLDAVHNETWDRLRLDDKGYRPTPADPLLRGPARVTSATARAAQRRKATTKHEYDNA